MSKPSMLKLGKAILVGGSALAITATATPAHAAPYAMGTFNYIAQGNSICIETYAGSGVGTANCSVSLSIGTFSLVVTHRDGTCSGIAPATLTVTSPSTPNAPAAEGDVEVSHGIASFEGVGTDGLIITLADAKLTGSRCKPENVLGSTQSLSGHYHLHA